METRSVPTGTIRFDAMYPNIPAIDRVERYRPIVPDWTMFMKALRRPLPLCLWVNTLRTRSEDVAHQLAIEGVDARPVGWHPDAFKGPPSETAGQCLPFIAGHYHIQEEVSLLPVVLLDARPGERVLDLCAAPGNKTAQAAVMMENTGTLVANDRSALRMRATRGTLDRLGVMNTAITLQDAERYPTDALLFDRVLLDAPCTCEGTSRKNVSAFVATGIEKSMALHDRQLAMLRRAIELCRPGGRIVYSTCTYAPEENELVVDDALREFGSVVRLLPAGVDGFASSPGLTAWNGHTFHSDLEKAMRVWPHQNDSGGFFVAVLEKAEDFASSRDRRAVKAIASSNPREHGEWIDRVIDRFGVPRTAFAGWRLHRPNRKYVFAVPNDQQNTEKPPPVSNGLPFMRTNLRHPKLTTAAARIIGPHAVKNVVDATPLQAEKYVSREEFTLTRDQLTRLTETGYLIVRHRSMVLGVGIYFEDGRRVSSMFPKVLSRAVSFPIPGGNGT